MPSVLSYPYCSLLEVQKETRNSDTKNTDWFIDCINLASRAVDSYCRRDFKFHDHTVTPYRVPLSLIYENQVFLEWPVRTIDSIYFDGLLIPEESWEYNGLIITFDNPFELKPVNNKLDIYGKFGYDFETVSNEPAADLPPLIRRACVLTASAFTVQKRIELVPLERDNTPVNTLDTSIPSEAMKLLKRYVIIAV